MINLLQTEIDIEYAKKEHISFFSCYLKKRIFRKECSKAKCKNCKIIPFKRNRTHHILESYYKTLDSVDKIITLKPQELKSLSSDLVKFINNWFKVDIVNYYKSLSKEAKTKAGEIHTLMLDLHNTFNYKWFINLEPTEIYSSYELAKNLGVRSCTYCNRIYTLTKTSSLNKKLIRPQFDHWFPKYKHPIMALSFYNLIPCCNYCNSSSKRDEELNFEEYIHPYIIEEDEEEGFYFTYNPKEKIDEFNIQVKSKNKTSLKTLKTIEKLRINEMYQAHYPELKDLIKLKEKYSESYLKTLKKSFPDANLTDQEIYRLAFGVELNEKNFHKKPMSKFKRDILIQLGIKL